MAEPESDSHSVLRGMTAAETAKDVHALLPSCRDETAELILTSPVFFQEGHCD